MEVDGDLKLFPHLFHAGNVVEVTVRQQNGTWCQLFSFQTAQEYRRTLSNVNDDAFSKDNSWWQESQASD